MDPRNRIGLHGAYFLGMAGIGFTLPYLPLYLSERGLSDRAIGIISTFAALSGLAQFQVGEWSDRLGRRKPFILLALLSLAIATIALPWVENVVLLAIVVVLFAENGICRAIVETQSGAAAVGLSNPDQVAASLGKLRFWKPIGIIVVALAGGRLAARMGIDVMLVPLGVAGVLSVLAALLIHEPARVHPRAGSPDESDGRPTPSLGRDRALWWFIAAMVLFHMANAPGGVYLGLFLTRELHANQQRLADAFVVSMIIWMLVSRPAGALADRIGRRPLLIACWTGMALRLLLVAVAGSANWIVAIQALDGFSNGLFAILAAAWMTDRLGGAIHAGRAQAIVGTSLVLGSAIGPAASSMLVDLLGYRGLFALLAAVGAVGTGLIIAFVPETLAPDETLSNDRFHEHNVNFITPAEAASA